MQKHTMLLMCMALPCLFPAAAGATMIWQADPSKGTASFGTLNLEGGATITVADDPTYGKVYKCFHPPASGRCETSHLPNDLHAKEGDLWYIGWRFKVDMPQNQTDNAVFQWKSYPRGKQNWPVILKHMGGTFTLLYHNPNYVSEYPWKGPTVTNQWISIVVGLKVSRDPKVGYIEYWHNGQQVTFGNGTTRYPARTLDDGYNDPKWGIYGASGATMTNYVFPPKIATTYEEVAPEGSAPVIRPLVGRKPLQGNRVRGFFGGDKGDGGVMAMAPSAEIYELTGRSVSLRSGDGLYIQRAEAAR
jgi:hypothetical protein